jgi:ribosomal protein L37E
VAFLKKSQKSPFQKEACDECGLARKNHTRIEDWAQILLKLLV